MLLLVLRACSYASRPSPVVQRHLRFLICRSSLLSSPLSDDSTYLTYLTRLDACYRRRRRRGLSRVLVTTRRCSLSLQSSSCASYRTDDASYGQQELYSCCRCRRRLVVERLDAFDVYLTRLDGCLRLRRRRCRRLRLVIV